MPGRAFTGYMGWQLSLVDGVVDEPEQDQVQEHADKRCQQTDRCQSLLSGTDETQDREDTAAGSKDAGNKGQRPEQN